MRFRTFAAATVLAVLGAHSIPSFASDASYDAVAVQGYDVVAYFTQGKPVKGDGNHVAEYDGFTYLFANEEDKKIFESDPGAYLPQYGGWCAFGVSKGKKFVADPLAWKIVDHKLYLNLNQSIADIWSKDIPGKIREADRNWPEIRDKPAREVNQ